MIRWDGRLRWTTLDQWWWPGSAPHCWSGVGGGWSTWSATAPSVLCLLWVHTLPARWETRNYLTVRNVVLLLGCFAGHLWCAESWVVSVQCVSDHCQPWRRSSPHPPHCSPGNTLHTHGGQHDPGPETHLREDVWPVSWLLQQAVPRSSSSTQDCQW